jgi:hypothetical protein
VPNLVFAEWFVRSKLRTRLEAPRTERIEAAASGQMT